MNYIQNFSSYITDNIVIVQCVDVKEIAAIYFDNHLKYTSAVSGQNSVSERKSTWHVSYNWAAAPSGACLRNWNNILYPNRSIPGNLPVLICKTKWVYTQKGSRLLTVSLWVLLKSEVTVLTYIIRCGMYICYRMYDLLNNTVVTVNQTLCVSVLPGYDIAKYPERTVN